MMGVFSGGGVLRNACIVAGLYGSNGAEARGIREAVWILSAGRDAPDLATRGSWRRGLPSKPEPLDAGGASAFPEAVFDPPSEPALPPPVPLPEPPAEAVIPPDEGEDVLGCGCSVFGVGGFRSGAVVLGCPLVATRGRVTVEKGTVFVLTVRSGTDDLGAALPIGLPAEEPAGIFAGDSGAGMRLGLSTDSAAGTRIGCSTGLAETVSGKSRRTTVTGVLTGETLSERSSGLITVRVWGPGLQIFAIAVRRTVAGLVMIVGR